MKLLITTQAIDENDPILGFFVRWVEEFAKHFEHIHVICLTKGEYHLPDNVTVYSLGKEEGESRLKYMWRFYGYFSHIFFKEKVDFVFFHMGAVYNIMAAPYFLVRSINNVKFIWWKTHGVLPMKEKLASIFVDEIVTAGDKSFNFYRKKVRVIGHAIDVSLFKIYEGARNTSGIAVIGRVVPIKKVDVAIEVVSRIYAEIDKNIQLHIYGPMSDANYKQQLDEKINMSNFGSHVHFHGSRSQKELVDVLNQHSILLHPCESGGMDKVVLEAMSTGVVPVTSIVSFKPLLDHYGLYVEGNNVEAYTNVVKSILKMTSGELLNLQKELRKLIKEKHSLSTLTKRIFNHG